MFRKTAAAAILGGALLPGIGSVQAADPAPTPEHNFTGNVGLFSQYIFRGLSQTNRDPAVQGGFDYAHASGLYAGTWASNISWLRENATTLVAGAPFVQGTYNQGGSLEWDFYGGYKGTVGDFGFDVGTLYYWYPGKINPAIVAANSPFSVPKANTWEAYLGGSWKWLGAKVSYSINDETFGVADSSGTIYLDLSANVPLGDFVKELTGFTINAHWGWQKFRGTDPRNFFFRGSYGGAIPDNDELFSYKDVKLGLTYALPKDFTIGAFYSKALSTNNLGYGSVNDVDGAGNRGPFPRGIGKGTGTIFVQKTF
jgi:uncharacterized protein (TIGR02001 family)